MLNIAAFVDAVWELYLCFSESISPFFGNDNPLFGGEQLLLDPLLKDPLVRDPFDLSDGCWKGKNGIKIIFCTRNNKYEKYLFFVREMIRNFWMLERKNYKKNLDK